MRPPTQPESEIERRAITPRLRVGDYNGGWEAIIASNFAGHFKRGG
jgi:hypothetical protein